MASFGEMSRSFDAVEHRVQRAVTLFPHLTEKYPLEAIRRVFQLYPWLDAEKMYEPKQLGTHPVLNDNQAYFLTSYDTVLRTFKGVDGVKLRPRMEIPGVVLVEYLLENSYVKMLRRKAS